MVALPAMKSPTVDAIYSAYESNTGASRLRGHLGASVIGKECNRELWYDFRWCAFPELPGRVLRLFETGHLEEARVVGDLRNIGCTVHETDPATRQQFRYHVHGGHYAGSLDGVVLGLPEAPKTWHLLEIKTHNDKSFARLKRDGVREAKPLHWHQMQTYMGMAGLERALYFAVCKNTDELYVERLAFEKRAFVASTAKALRIIQAKEPLTRISSSSSAFACRWCDFKDVCHADRLPPVHCRTCVHARPITEGTDAGWMCHRHSKELTGSEQRRGCDDHLFIPALVGFAIPTDTRDGWVAYRTNLGDQAFINCAANGFSATDVPHFSSEELRAVDPAAIGDAAVESARRILGGTIVDSTGIRG